MNSPQCKAFTKLWVEMIQKAGPKNWTNYTWYEVGNDLGAGASAMIFDADILGFFQQEGTKEAGNIGYQAFAANPDKKEPTPNVWIWSLAMNAASDQQGRRLAAHAVGGRGPADASSAPPRPTWSTPCASRSGTTPSSRPA